MAEKHTFLGIISVRGGGAIPPVLALAQGLSNRGHEVILICDEGSRSQVDALGLKAIVIPTEHDLVPYWGPEKFADWRDLMSNGGTLEQLPNPFNQFAEEAFPFVAESSAAAHPALIFSSLFTPGLAAKLSSELAVPWCFVNPAYVFGKGNKRSEAEDFGDPIGEYAHRVWFRSILKTATLVIHTTDREYDPVTSELPGTHHQVGPLHMEEVSKVPDYLHEEGPPWVLITVATGPQLGELEIVNHALQALANKDVRVLATVPKRVDEITDIPDNATVVDFAPHEEVLKRCVLAISHAGHGLVMRALGNGVPLVLVPWGRDQPGVAYRAEQLGVAAVVERANLSQQSMFEAVDRVLNSEDMRNKSAQVAKRLAVENPVGRACDLLEAEIRR